ncbi:MAG: hypothetical protein OYG31_00615 [Candidatus Kaiserbacteria bacterium]|nr:hypothetical protein [Candidatus Kaiserbacteria bacterium]
MVGNVKEKHLTPLQVVTLSLLALVAFGVGISAIGTDSEIRQPSSTLFDNSQTVSIL